MSAEVSRARRATAWVFFANGAALGSWVPHIPGAKHALGLSDGLLGLALLGMAAGSLLGLPLSGLLTARFGSCRTTTAAILALLLATPLPLLAPSLAVFAAALVLLGIANGAVDVAMNTQATAVEERVGRAIMSGFHGFFSAGGLAGAAAAGLAMEAGIGPRAHLTASVALLLSVTLWAVRFLLPTAPAAAETAILRLPRGPLFAVGVFALCSLLAEGAMGDWAAVYLREDLGTGAGYAALGFAGFSLAMAAGRFLGDRVVRRYGGPAVLGAGAGIASALLTAGLLVLVNTISNFELAFLLAGGGSQTLVVALYYNVFAGGVRPVYSIDAMAVIYMVMIMSVLIVALRFVRPTQMVFRLDQPRH